MSSRSCLKLLFFQVRGSHVGSYLPSFGVWHHTQRFLKMKKDDPAIVQHMDFDAPTREAAQQLPDDKVLKHPFVQSLYLLILLL